MEESCVEDAGNQATDLDSPVVEGSEDRVNLDEVFSDDLQHTKIGFNRSESCGSILQSNGINKMRNLSRRVSFPSDDKLISGYNEPKNPWEHAEETTTEDLIQSYTESCQTWNVRPISKLLVQLQEIRDFTVRANSLTLKGEKLEMRVVETLETIFKRVQFITIDLEATNLDEDAGASLFDMIEYYESAVNVLVGFNKNLGNRGWQAAAHMMRKMSCLRLFDGHSVPLSIQASPFVGRALRLSNTLVTLHLENTMLSGRPVLLIVAALRMNTTLRELFLADNRLTPLDALQLANLMKFNRILQLLDLRNNPIQDMGLGHLCSGLMAASSSAGFNGISGGLQTLVLWNNQISCEGMTNLARALRYTTSLATLNLGQNVLTDDGVFRLKDGLLQNHSLLRLGLVGTKLTDEGAVAIAEYLAESPRIIRLDLRNNDIKVAGLMALSLAFKINYSLLRLDFDKPNKKDALKELAAKQESLMTDIISYSNRNKQGALEKAQAAQRQREEARQSQLKQENEIRYMDMTNSTSVRPTAISSEISANNSNNQKPIEQDGEEQVKVMSEISKEPNKQSPPQNTEDDDSPEDSPEFLPRSSLSYHQVAPVMLSNSEMAKRAAQIKLSPVEEQHEEILPNSASNKVVGARLADVQQLTPGGRVLAGLSGPADAGEPNTVEGEPTDLNKFGSTDASEPADISKPVPADAGEPNIVEGEPTDLNKPAPADAGEPNTVEGEPTFVEPADIRKSETADAGEPNTVDGEPTDLNKFGPTDDGGEPTPVEPADTVIENKPADTVMIDVSVDISLPGSADTAEPTTVEGESVHITKPAADTGEPAEISKLDCADISDPAAGNTTHVESSEAVEFSKPTVDDSEPAEGGDLNDLGAVESSQRAEGDLYQFSSSNHETISFTPDSSMATPDASTVTIAMTTVATSDDKLVETFEKVVLQDAECDNTESSGFGAEDSSMISGDLSPCDVSDKTINEGLLSPDSGVVRFENGDSGKISGVDEYISEKITGAAMGEDPTSNTPLKNTEQNLEENQHEDTTQKQSEINSKYSNFSDDHLLEEVIHISHDNNLSAGDVPQFETTKSPPQNLDQCEVEVSHYDLNKFPTGD